MAREDRDLHVREGNGRSGIRNSATPSRSRARTSAVPPRRSGRPTWRSAAAARGRPRKCRWNGCSRRVEDAPTASFTDRTASAQASAAKHAASCRRTLASGERPGAAPRHLVVRGARGLRWRVSRDASTRALACPSGTAPAAAREGARRCRPRSSSRIAGPPARPPGGGTDRDGRVAQDGGQRPHPEQRPLEPGRRAGERADRGRHPVRHEQVAHRDVGRPGAAHADGVPRVQDLGPGAREEHAEDPGHSRRRVDLRPVAVHFSRRHGEPAGVVAPARGTGPGR